MLSVENLSVEFLREGHYHTVVNNVSFAVQGGETLGIAGESGSGKTVSCMSVMHLLPSAKVRVSGKAMFSPNHPDNALEATPVNLLSLSDDAMRNCRGSRISMVFQEPMTSLNPVQRCGEQVVEMLRLHEDVSRSEARKRVIALFNEVKLPRAEKIFDSYPHEISGGQKQRVVIAMALVCHPDVVIADEPTTALDVTVQKAILELLKELQNKYGIAIIFITHDLGVMAQVADRLVVMYHGEVVEQGDAEQVLRHPGHPYTQRLLSCSRLEARNNKPLHAADEKPLLSVRDLCVSYALKKNIFGRPLQELDAVNKVSFDLYKGETLGLVGESGCGKSTLGRAILRLVSHRSGSIIYNGVPLDTMRRAELKALRRRMQIVFQDPYSSLNPRLTVGEAVMEPLLCHRMVHNKAECREKAMDMLKRVGLNEEHFHRYPHEFSGGQRQRICIARTLVMKPELVICDESVSALDVSVRAQILALLGDLRQQYGYTYLFITHDLSVVRAIADRVMVMQGGKIVEMNTADALFDNPQQDYTRTLLDSVPHFFF